MLLASYHEWYPAEHDNHLWWSQRCKWLRPRHQLVARFNIFGTAINIQQPMQDFTTTDSDKVSHQILDCCPCMRLLVCNCSPLSCTQTSGYDHGQYQPNITPLEIFLNGTMMITVHVHSCCSHLLVRIEVQLTSDEDLLSASTQTLLKFETQHCFVHHHCSSFTTSSTTHNINIVTASASSSPANKVHDVAVQLWENPHGCSIIRSIKTWKSTDCWTSFGMMLTLPPLEDNISIIGHQVFFILVSYEADSWPAMVWIQEC